MRRDAWHNWLMWNIERRFIPQLRCCRVKKTVGDLDCIGRRAKVTTADRGGWLAMTLQRYWGLENCRSLYLVEMILYSMRSWTSRLEPVGIRRIWSELVSCNNGTNKRILDMLNAMQLSFRKVVVQSVQEMSQSPVRFTFFLRQPVYVGNSELKLL